MIASGLCMMGGCFAQDETSRTVDTYWVAEKLHLDSGVQNVVIASVPFSGGDSRNDVFRITYQADFYDTSYLIAGLRPVEGKVGILIYQGSAEVCLLGQQNGNTANWNEVQGEKFTWWAEGGMYKHGENVRTLYAYQDAGERYLNVGSALKRQNRIIYNVEYANKQTRVRLQWQPMVGMTGAAFFEPTTGTLAEQ